MCITIYLVNKSAFCVVVIYFFDTNILNYLVKVCLVIIWITLILLWLFHIFCWISSLITEEALWISSLITEEALWISSVEFPP